MRKRSLFRVFATLCTVVLGASQLFSSASAAVLSSRSVIMQRDQPGVASNQEIRFTTPSGVNAAGETIRLTYPYNFDLSAIAFGDVDLFYGTSTAFEVSATLAATPGVNTWGVSVSGRELTFTAPTNGGPVSAGQLMAIRIGTNASGGTNRIINPTGGGSAVFLAIDGTFGDSAGFDIPIYTNDFISITATVPNSSTSSTLPPPPPPGGGGGPGTDGTAPTIFNVQVINITTSTATVIWNTDEAANGTVQYGLTPAYGGVATHASFVTSHSITLSGLSVSTTYNFNVSSADSVGNAASTVNFTFTTLPPPQPPIINNIQVINITDSSAVVTWQTNVPASSFVDYGLTPVYTNTANDPALVTSHSVFLSGLSTNTLYHFRVGSTESTGLSSVSGDSTFTTLADTTPPSNVFGFTATAGDAQNTLSWTNPPDADFVFVRIRARTDGYPTGPTDGRFVYQGSAESFVDGGLSNGVTYYYANYALDASGNPASGAFAQATPFGVLPPVPPPATTTPPTPPTPPGTTTTPPIPPVTTTTPPIPTPVPTPTSTEPEIPSNISINPDYYGANGTIPLQENAAGEVGTVVGRPVMVRVPTAGIGSNPESAYIDVGGSRYNLSPVGDNGEYGASFIPSNTVGRVPARVTFRFPDGTVSTADVVLESQGFGRIYGRQGISPITQPLGNARVTLYEQTVSGWRVWDGSRYGQANPIITGNEGLYAFTVANGQYRIVVEREGYARQERTFSVTKNVVSLDIVLAQEIDVPVIGPLLAIIQSEAVQEAANIAAPLAVAVAIANVAFAASLLSIFNYLWFLFTQPLLLIGRKKRQRWGIVYNALSKTPIDLAAVRLVHAKTNLILQTRITDIKGRFSFHVRPGQYRVEAVKAGFTFPSEYVKGVTEDGEFVDIYHGEIINVQEETNIAVNIPLDPSAKEETPRAFLFKRALRRLQSWIGLISVFVTLGSLVISPSYLLFGLLVGQILIYLLFRRLAMPRPPKGWGIVYDSGTRRPMSGTIVRIFDRKFNKLLETQVTDRRGNYGFFAKKNVYFITADKPEYERYKSEDIDLTKQEQAVIDRHINLEKKKK